MFVVEYVREHHAYRISEQFVKQRLERYLTALHLDKHDVSLTVSIVGNATIKRFNTRYRHHSKVTDVLAFEHHQGKWWIPSRKKVVFGEIIICYPQTQKQAREFGWSLRKEFLRLLIHGLLHVLGYDHIKKEDAIKMQAMEEKLMRLQVIC